MTTSAQALVLAAAPGRFVVMDIMVDEPGPGEVLVRSRAAGVCHSDVHFRDGLVSTSTPSVLGHEVSGEVVAVGAGVSYLRPGDHVVGCMTVFCGECSFCLTGHMTLCERRSVTQRPDGAPPRLSCDGMALHQFASLSAFADHLLVHERALVRVDEDLAFDIAALLGCAVVTGVGAVLNTAGVRPGESVAVVGCGGVGINCIQGARLAGASRIIAIDTNPAKLERARLFGATETVVSGPNFPAAEVLDLTRGGVDHAFEAVGSPALAGALVTLTRRGGSATLVGMLPAGAQISVPGAALMAERRLLGSPMGSTRFRLDIPSYIEHYRAGRLMLDELVSSRIGLADVDAACDALLAGADIVRSVVIF